MIFKKYEFTNEEEWLTIRETLYKEVEEGEKILIAEVAAIHEIGHICFAYNEEGECTDLSTKYAVDILWNVDLGNLVQYEVYPNPDGIHIFAGCAELYLKSFCEVNPESPFCQTEEE
jgi:hypothetical protein